VNSFAILLEACPCWMLAKFPVRGLAKNQATLFFWPGRVEFSSHCLVRGTVGGGLVEIVRLSQRPNPHNQSIFVKKTSASCRPRFHYQCI
jgi:hypothetical protein